MLREDRTQGKRVPEQRVRGQNPTIALAVLLVALLVLPPTALEVVTEGQQFFVAVVALLFAPHWTEVSSCRPSCNKKQGKNKQSKKKKKKKKKETTTGVKAKPTKRVEAHIKKRGKLKI